MEINTRRNKSRPSEEMAAIARGSSNLEPEWNRFSIDLCDFRPDWNGDLVNICSVIKPKQTEGETSILAADCARRLARWILDNRTFFGSEDKFQIIIGWPKFVRETARQIIKTGGNLAEIEKIVSGGRLIEMRHNWSLGIFDPQKSSEQRAL